MNVTFLIGNGFDMRMGIASSYKSVEDHYIGLERTDKTIKAFQQSLKEQGEYWSDFELAIGKYTALFNDDDQQSFISCLEDFTMELVEYLQSEEDKVDFSLCDKEIKEEFWRSIKSFDDELGPAYKKQINGILATGEAVVFRFISFNYTHLLDKCLETAFDAKTIVGSHAIGNTSYNHTVNKHVIHIHGELPGPVLMGVDNGGQIEKEVWAKQRRFIQSMAKPLMNERFGSLVDVETLNTINRSNVICLFGLSMGETDHTWWKSIGNWLNDQNHRLVIFGHISKLEGRSLTIQRRFRLEDDIKDRFMDLAEIGASDRSEIESRIFVYINSTLFNINLVELTTKKRKAAEKESEAKEIEVLSEKYKKKSELATVT